MGKVGLRLTTSWAVLRALLVGEPPLYRVIAEEVLPASVEVFGAWNVDVLNVAD